MEATASQPRIQHRFVIFMLCFWCGWTGLKFFNVQLLEMFMLLHLSFLITGFLLRGFRVSVYGYWIRPGAWFGAIMAGIFLLDLFDLRQPRFPPHFAPPLIHNPYLLLLSRYIELFIVVFYCIYAAEFMRRDPRLRYYGMRMYAVSAMVSVWYTLLSYFPYHMGAGFVGMYEGDRGRGGFTEGGPWGLYLMTACIVGRVLYVRGKMSRGFTILYTVSMALGLLSARSKASAAAGVSIFAIATFLRSSFRQKVTSLVIAGFVVLIAWFGLDIPGQYRGLLKLRQEAELLVWIDPMNPSTAYGRVAASVIVPRMIQDHWFSGIGWGMYPVARNDPKYLGIMPPVISYDLPGLGLLSDAAELGIPALILMYVMMFYPVHIAGKVRAHRLVGMMGLAAPVVFLAGAQFTLYYPWLMTAFAMSWLPLQHGRAAAVKFARPMLPTVSGSQVGAAG